MKIFTLINYINRILIGIWGAIVLYYISNRSGHSDGTGQGLETAVPGIGFFYSCPLA
ncbi:hypothetical protein [Spirosoma endophyticum]|uniref:Uncharacterized protein n=1 Tax=Spirosoma endophyticum TaxID=662367 RepID=A0A1I1GUY3_9BACT|nr:hypothetical protein [Spirosoma endophyticum]SFC12820.1 hypothetical protein SAMN05216167_101514 [Spirosoma endophyticum]